MKKKSQHKMTLKKREALFGLLLMAPWLIGLFAFTLYPILYSFWMSICRMSFSVSGLQSEFVGLQWYRAIFLEDATFLASLLDTLKFIVFSTPMILVAATVLAILLNSIVKGRTFFRALFFFPVMVISGPIMNRLINNNATSIIQADQYIVYDVIAQLPDVISVPLLYIFDNIVVILWYSGLQILIILVGLQRIGRPLYEAAEIDGASSWQKFWTITFPMIRPMILLSGIYTVVQLANLSDNSIVKLISNDLTMIDSPYSYSAAISWLYTLAVLLILGIVFLLLRERRKDNGAK